MGKLYDNEEFYLWLKQIYHLWAFLNDFFLYG